MGERKEATNPMTPHVFDTQARTMQESRKSTVKGGREGKTQWYIAIVCAVIGTKVLDQVRLLILPTDTVYNNKYKIIN